MWGSIFSKHLKPASSEPSASTFFRNPLESREPKEQPEVPQSANGSGETSVEVRDQQGKQSMLRLLEELDNNRKTARSSYGSKLVPLQTDVWDASQSIIRTLDPGLRRDLESVYADIRLLNQLVWLSSEFHRSSRAMLSQYADLSLVIAKRLDEIVESPRSGLTPT